MVSRATRLNPGPLEALHVLRVRYGKDVMALRVESPLGIGWIIYNSRNVEIQRVAGVRL
jgi:hypothetical protein